MLHELTVRVAVSVEPCELWLTGSANGWTVGVFDGERLRYKLGGTAGFPSVVLMNFQRRTGGSLVGGSLYGDVFAFAHDVAGVMELSWRGYRFTRSR